MKDTRQLSWWTHASEWRKTRWPLEVATPYHDLIFGITHRHSQFREDAIIQRMLGQMGYMHRNAFECGAGDGFDLSNTLLFGRWNWDRYLVESNEDEARRAILNALPFDHVVQRTLTRDNVNQVMDEIGVPVDLEIMSLDIDGDDWGVWNAMTRKARVACVEFNPGVDAPPNVKDQTGLTAIVDLGLEKGYVPVAITFCNVIFAREDAWLI